MNKFIGIGRLSKDPEAYTTQNGIARSTFSIAIQRRAKNSEGKHDVDFFTVVAWRQTADFCNRYLTKGRMVSVEGELQNRSYDDKNGQKHYVTEIIASNVEALSSPNQTANTGTTNGGFQEVDPGDELPF